MRTMVVCVYYLRPDIYCVNLEACGEDQSPGGAATIVKSMQIESPGGAEMIVRLLQTEEPRWGCINNEIGATRISVLNKPK